MYAQICDCNINLNLVAKDISQFSNAAAAYAPRRRHRRHRKAQHNAQRQIHLDCVQKIMENLMEYLPYSREQKHVSISDTPMLLIEINSISNMGCQK